jgi:hypothetical protein
MNITATYKGVRRGNIQEYLQLAETLKDIPSYIDLFRKEIAKAKLALSIKVLDEFLGYEPIAEEINLLWFEHIPGSWFEENLFYYNVYLGLVVTEFYNCKYSFTFYPKGLRPHAQKNFFTFSQ